MLDYMQATILIYFKKNGKTNVDNRIFDDIRSFNSCFNEINNINAKKEVWVDECYISFTFMSERSYKKALDILNPSY